MHHLDGHFAITLKLTAEQHRWLLEASEEMSRLKETSIGQHAILGKLLELGLPRFEEELALEKQRARALAAQRRPRFKVVAGQGEKA